MKNAVISIWYDNKSYPQGKFYSEGKKSYYIANIDDAKLFRTYNGWAISKRLLDRFSQLKIRNLTIVYRYVSKKTVYMTTPSVFKSKGIGVAFGGHSQYVLPISYWKIQNIDFTSDLKDLPIIDLEKWSRNEAEPVFIGNTAYYPEKEKQLTL